MLMRKIVFNISGNSYSFYVKYKESDTDRLLSCLILFGQVIQKEQIFFLKNPSLFIVNFWDNNDFVCEFEI